MLRTKCWTNYCLRNNTLPFFSVGSKVQPKTERNNNQFSDDRDQKKSQKVLAELENIDDECDQNNIVFVKIDNDEEAKEYGIDVIPSLVLFEKKIPHLYEGIDYYLINKSYQAYIVHSNYCKINY